MLVLPFCSFTKSYLDICDSLSDSTFVISHWLNTCLPHVNKNKSFPSFLLLFPPSSKGCLFDRDITRDLVNGVVIVTINQLNRKT